jgi:hypothetical protein
MPLQEPTAERLWIRYVPTVEALRKALAEFATFYGASWLRECHGHQTPNQIRAEQKDLASQATKEFKRRLRSGLCHNCAPAAGQTVPEQPAVS